MWKWISAVLAGALATLTIIFTTQKPDNIIVDGDYIEKQKKTDNSKFKSKKGLFGFFKADPNRKAARKAKRILRREKK